FDPPSRHQLETSDKIDRRRTDRLRVSDLGAVAIWRPDISDVSSGTAFLYRRRCHCRVRCAVVVDAADRFASRTTRHCWLVRHATERNAAPDSAGKYRQVRSRYLPGLGYTDHIAAACGCCGLHGRSPELRARTPNTARRRIFASSTGRLRSVIASVWSATL